MIFKVARHDKIHEAAVLITKGMRMLCDSYDNMPLGEKVALFEFRLDDANYNRSLHREELRI